jgi:phage protein D
VTRAGILGAPSIGVTVNGRALPATAASSIESVTVQDDVEALSMFTIVLNNWDAERLQVAWSDSTLFALGSAVEISLGFVDDLHKVMLGEITSLEPQFTAEREPTLTVRGYDHRHRLARGGKTRTFTKMKDSAIAAQIAREAGLRAQATDSKITLPYVVQSNQTDLEFLRRRARICGFEIYVRDRVLHFRPPPIAAKPAVALALNDDLTEFTARLSTLGQTGTATVRGWDVKQKAVVLGRATVGQEAATMNGRSSGPKAAQKAFGKAATDTVDVPVSTKAAADQMALGRYNEMALAYIQGEATCTGRPQLQAGMVVAIEGAGVTFSGHYYLTSVTHTVVPDEGYRTYLQLRRNSA